MPLSDTDEIKRKNNRLWMDGGATKAIGRDVSRAPNGHAWPVSSPAVALPAGHAEKARAADLHVDWPTDGNSALWPRPLESVAAAGRLDFGQVSRQLETWREFEVRSRVLAQGLRVVDTLKAVTSMPSVVTPVDREAIPMLCAVSSAATCWRGAAPPMG